MDLIEIFNYSFFRNAMLAALLVSIVGGFIGSYIVTKRIVFFGGGIAHASFGGVGIAWFFGLNPIFIAALFALLSTYGIQYLSQKKHMRSDSAIGVFWSIGMSLGVILIYLTPGYAPNLLTFLFGNILMVNWIDIMLLGSLAVVLLVFFICYYRAILFVAYDESYAMARHFPVHIFSTVLLSLLALAIVFSIKAVGVVMVIAMLTIPQAIANLLIHDFKWMILLSTLFGVIGSVLGLMISYYFNIPSGATIVFSLGVLFVVIKGVVMVSRRCQKVAILNSH